MKKPFPFLYDVLSNGVQVAAESFDNVQSVSIGFFFKSGVLYEKLERLGASHFIEHMLFKGTKKRSPKDIARQFDRIGGHLNAFTSKDYCCYYARVVKDNLDEAVEVLADMVCNSTFDKTELERERGVILEEIKMYEDSPDELIHELLGLSLWHNSPLGRPILGTSATVGGMTRTQIVEIYERQYVAENLMVCAAGNVDWTRLLKLLTKHLSGLRTGNFRSRKEIPEPCYEVKIFQKEIEQVHVALGAPGTSYGDSRRYALTLLNTVFGGGMSSRLFQEIREKRGMAYSVYSYHTAFRDSGIFAIYAGTSLEHLQRVLDLVHKEVEKVAKHGLNKTELAEAKQQIRGNLLIGMESTTNRMNRLVTEFLYDFPPQNPTSAIEPYMAVTQADIIEVAREILNEKRMAMTVISPDPRAAEIIRQSPFSRRPITSLPISERDRPTRSRTK
ncbi:MAG TPA: pitrilysin family protein [Candidatus Ozemobacteraceae bacterium]|nr:pitrilysin family protein [Candidatus Ozemobacteraceae bacterium]